MLLAVCGAYLMMSAACRREQAAAPDIERWLHCEECLDGEREAVRALGAAGIPELRRALLDGPRRAERDAMVQQYRSAHRSIPDPSSLESDYIGTLLEGYVASYQSRAIVGLADIGGPEARQALEEALARPSGFRSDVVDALRVAIALFEADRFTLSATPERVAFGDTLTISRPAGPRLDAFEAINIQSAIYPDSLVRVPGAGDSQRLIVTALPGERIVSVKNPADASDSSLAIIAVWTLSDANDRLLGECASFRCLADSAPQLVGDSGSATQFLSLWRTQGTSDTMDAFRVFPSQMVSVVASLDWRPAGQLDLVWERCSDGTRLPSIPPRTPPPPIGSAAQVESGPGSRRSWITLPARNCYLLKVLLLSGQDGVVGARLNIESAPGADLPPPDRPPPGRPPPGGPPPGRLPPLSPDPAIP